MNDASLLFHDDQVKKQTLGSGLKKVGKQAFTLYEQAFIRVWALHPSWMSELAESSQQPDTQEANGSAEGIDEEVGAEAKLLYKPAAYGHRQKQGDGDKRYLKHVDGVAVAASRNGADGKTANTKPQAEQELGCHRAKAQLPKAIGRPDGHAKINERREDDAQGHRPEESLQRIVFDERPTYKESDTKGNHAYSSLRKANLLHRALQTALQVRHI